MSNTLLQLIFKYIYVSAASALVCILASLFCYHLIKNGWRGKMCILIKEKNFFNILAKPIPLWRLMTINSVTIERICFPSINKNSSSSTKDGGKKIEKSFLTLIINFSFFFENNVFSKESILRRPTTKGKKRHELSNQKLLCILLHFYFSISSFCHNR